MVFPKNFIWGTGTAAFQIEGGSYADGREDSIWDTFCRIPGKIERGETAETASDHYRLWREDLDLLKKYKIPNYRFSLSWPRLMKEAGRCPNEGGLRFYNNLVDGLLERGIVPWITLYHWDLPQALQDKGGWTSRESIGWFSDYAEFVFKTFGDRVSNWLILNEPSTVSLIGHGYGFYAPGLASVEAYAACTHHQNLAIGQAYRLAKTLSSKWNIGSAYTCLRTPDESGDHCSTTAEIFHNLWNENFLDPLLLGRYPKRFEKVIAPYVKEGDMDICKTPLDFVGLQHYSSIPAGEDKNRIFDVFFGKKRPDSEKTDIGWLVNPEDFLGALQDFVQKYGQQRIIITENGAAYDDRIINRMCYDTKRISYLQRYLTALKQAISAGINIEGYFVWSFLDNFEWSEGFRPRFGLVYVDYKNGCERIPKESLAWYQKIIEKNGASL